MKSVILIFMVCFLPAVAISSEWRSRDYEKIRTVKKSGETNVEAYKKTHEYAKTVCQNKGGSGSYKQLQAVVPGNSGMNGKKYRYELTYQCN